jgi:hypothetical protein
MGIVSAIPPATRTDRATHPAIEIRRETTIYPIDLVNIARIQEERKHEISILTIINRGIKNSTTRKNT